MSKAKEAINYIKRSDQLIRQIKAVFSLDEEEASDKDCLDTIWDLIQTYEEETDNDND